MAEAKKKPKGKQKRSEGGGRSDGAVSRISADTATLPAPETRSGVIDTSRAPDKNLAAERGAAGQSSQAERLSERVVTCQRCGRREAVAGRPWMAHPKQKGMTGFFCEKCVPVGGK